MLKYLKNRRAQAVMGEYVLTVFMVVLMVIGMTVYFKRSIQGRIRDAKVYMINEVRQRTSGYYDNELYYEYEPYYINTNAEVTRDLSPTILLDAGGSSGIFTKIFNDTTVILTNSETAAPKDYQATTPR